MPEKIKSHDERAAKIARLEQQTADARLEHERQTALEAERRRPLNLLLDQRRNLKKCIERNKSVITHHQADADSFEKLCDGFFTSNGDAQGRIYGILVATQSFPHAAASRAVELLTARLVKAEKDLADLESKIVAEAEKLDLKEMLAAELQK
jgi:hypothetical protein